MVTQTPGLGALSLKTKIKRLESLGFTMSTDGIEQADVAIGIHFTYCLHSCEQLLLFPMQKPRECPQWNKDAMGRVGI